MPQVTEETTLNLEEFVELLYNELPEKMQTDSVKANLVLQANDIITNEISDYMSTDDLEDTVRLNQEMEIPLENVMETYVNENPELADNITESLDQYSQFILNFASSG